MGSPTTDTNDPLRGSRCELNKGDFPFWTTLGNLREHWYPLAFTHSLKRNRVHRQVALGIPIVIWRTDDGNCKAFVDICPHRQAQLSLGKANSQGLTCPYHGWRFDANGRCNHIPIAPPDRMPRETVSLTSIPLVEHAGIFWGWMGQGKPAAQPKFFELDGSGWRFTRATHLFPFDLDDVIENFMDFAHTAVVHPGLIRGISNPKARSVTIEVTESSVKGIHDPVDEKVGMLSGWVVPDGDVHHSDTFIIPGNIKVNYGFGSDEPSFVAFLGMTPVQENQTLILLTIGTKLGWLNPFISASLPWLIRKVLSQDAEILAQQRANLDLVSNRNSKSLASDSIDSIVRAMRAHYQDPSRPRPKPGSHQMLVQI